MRFSMISRRTLLVGSAAVMLAGGLLLGGCSNAARGAGAGAMLGTFAGAVIGDHNGAGLEGAAIGGAIGAGLGYIVGNEADKAEHNYYEHGQYYNDGYAGPPRYREVEIREYRYRRLPPRRYRYYERYDYYH